MSVKFTNTMKWDDVWFSQLTMEQKVMFIYLCDMCDIAGFYEINDKIISLRTGIEDVRGTITSLSKSIIFKDNHVWIKKYIKHQKNLPINVKNGAHKSILKTIQTNINKFPEIYDHLPVSDGETIKQYLKGKGEGGGGGASPREGRPPLGIGIGNSNSNSNSKTAVTTVTTVTSARTRDNEIMNETKIARLYKYFVGEENLMGQSITTGTREILIEAIGVMDVEKWKIFCDSRLKDEYKASPSKFFLEDGWRRYQESAVKVVSDKKVTETRRDVAKERAEMPGTEAPNDFKEFVKNLGKRTRDTETTPDPA